MNSVLRVIFALIAAGITSTVPFVILGLIGYWHNYPQSNAALITDLRILLIVLTVAFLHAVILGLPTYLMLNKFNLVRWWTSILSGFVIGCLPIALMTFPYHQPKGNDYVSNGAAMVVDGVTTPAGWISYVEGVLIYGGLGIIGGFSAWLVWKYFPRAINSNQVLH